MTTKTKKILALVCWLAFVIIWNMLPAYDIVQYNMVLARVVDVIITCVGSLIFLWIINPDFLKKRNKE